MEKIFGFFSEQLADSMTKKHLTAKALAPMVKCSYEFNRKMLLGQSLPSPQLLQRLCTVFGWNEEKLRRFVMMDQARKKFRNTFWILSGVNPKMEPVYILWEFLTPEERDYFADSLLSPVRKKRKKNEG